MEPSYLLWQNYNNSYQKEEISKVEDSEEEDSCEANADERESVRLTDEFDIGADLHKNQRRHRWDYFSMGDNMSEDNFPEDY